MDTQHIEETFQQGQQRLVVEYNPVDKIYKAYMQIDEGCDDPIWFEWESGTGNSLEQAIAKLNETIERWA